MTATCGISSQPASLSRLPCRLPTILTLPATGSEASDGTVVTNEEAQLKLPYGDVILRPVFSIMNPELYFTLPENQVANGVCDMMSHIMERYFTNTTHTDVTDGLCESVLRTIMSNARILKRDHTNYDAWAEIALAGHSSSQRAAGPGPRGGLGLPQYGA